MKSNDDEALLELGRELSALGYEFVTTTPQSHEAVLGRGRAARSLRDVFGWNRPFSAEVLPPALLSLSVRAGVVEQHGSTLRATVRFSTMDGHLFAHSAFPTVDADAVFFGPDTYRFCSFLRRTLADCKRLVDIGCGTGAGGVTAAPRARHVTMSDVNPDALRFAKINAALAGLRTEIVLSDVLASVEGPIDAVIANPPYLKDSSHRTYRDGGGRLGEGLSLRFVSESLARLEQGGRLYLYTGAPVVDGTDALRTELERLCRERSASLSYEELDPDVFGSELGHAPYADVDRVAAIGAVITRR
jgi:release factor glutamine methyltransferase